MTNSKKPFADANVIRGTREAIRQQPELGNLTFNMKSKSNGGVSVRVETHATIQNGQVDTRRSGKFANVGDEPADLSGTDSGMGPAEYILQALAGCYTATLTVMAAEKGIELDGIELDLNFDINLNGFLGLDEKVRNGAKAIRVGVKLSSPTASREQLDEMVRALPESSPIHDTLANPVNIDTRLV
ncbi:OsmC family protein [Rouxiella badensis]|uniref:OsmC family protein n=2 Tax=Rahnella TaxID=34037 RepID=A0ABS6L0Y6_9GAMM|nr:MULTISPECIES: OsmC family protein [Enterobacterales]AEX51823.1 putative redox protein, regulator of disulfide bond formation [Rahnella aquatilis CIP 78.65 = ATCC 33071]KFD15621.1 hypothetical protein GRAQ_00983 [Rahnella aquatilis CIP 78.65 = ATCC 33071]MBU9808645.1 OsmC family protein [Rahnella perminowiae]MBU9814985.1 OsmC family protein [Rahnella perminowiae]MBU9827941.1 OsmC family protein [Rahnella perminowiae]